MYLYMLISFGSLDMQLSIDSRGTPYRFVFSKYYYKL